MKAQTLFTLFSILALVIISAGAVSALSFNTPTSNHPTDKLTPYDNLTVTITNNDGQNLQNVQLAFTGTTSGLNGLAVSENNFDLADGASKDIIITVDTVSANLDIFRGISPALEATAFGATPASVNFEYLQTFCKSGPADHLDLEISNVDISNKGDSDGDDEEWFAFDDIEVEVEVEADKDYNDLIVEIGLFDSDGTNIIDDFEFRSGTDDEEEEIGDVDDDDSEEVTFRFYLDESDPDLEGNMDFVVKVYEEGNEDNVCIDYSDDLDNRNDFSSQIDLEREDDEDKFVRFNDIQVSSQQVTCGDPVRVTADAINVGDEEVEDLEVRLFNQEMGIDLTARLDGDLEEGEDETVNFDFTIPEGLDNKAYDLILTSRYEVDGDDTVSEESDLIRMNVIGCDLPDRSGDGSGSTGSSDGLTISAELASSAEAGEELAISITVTNTGDTPDTVTMDARSFDDWADLVSLFPRVLNLAPGQTLATTVLFTVGDDSVGPQSFIVEARGESTVEIQEIEVNIQGEEPSEGLDLDLSNLFSGENSALLWTIGIINLILIILIIIVAVRLARR